MYIMRGDFWANFVKQCFNGQNNVIVVSFYGLRVTSKFCSDRIVILFGSVANFFRMKVKTYSNRISGLFEGNFCIIIHDFCEDKRNELRAKRRKQQAPICEGKRKEPRAKRKNFANKKRYFFKAPFYSHDDQQSSPP